MSFLPGLRLTLRYTTPLLLSAPLLYAYQTHRPLVLRCDSPSSPLSKITDDLSRSRSDAQTPILTSSGHANPKAIRQVSMGSILGVLGGMGVSVFSKPLAILIGLGVLVVQFLESRGIHLIPYSYISRRFKQTNVQGLVRDNVAFKLAFGTTFALAAFADF